MNRLWKLDKYCGVTVELTLQLKLRLVLFSYVNFHQNKSLICLNIVIDFAMKIVISHNFIMCINVCISSGAKYTQMICSMNDIHVDKCWQGMKVNKYLHIQEMYITFEYIFFRNTYMYFWQRCIRSWSNTSRIVKICPILSIPTIIGECRWEGLFQNLPYFILIKVGNRLSWIS